MNMSIHYCRRLDLRLAALLGAALLLGIAATGPVHAGICRVTTSGTAANNGSTWTSPMDLQTALGDTDCSEIWVAAGVYQHEPAPSNNGASFVLSHDVALYGGFAATESSRSARNPAANASILSGVLPEGHSAHVLLVGRDEGTAITSNTVIDGFTITGGDAEDSPIPAGGGLACAASGVGSRCSPVIRNVTFSANRAEYGGAIYVFSSGGGMSNPTLVNVTFSDNRATIRSGAVDIRAEDDSSSAPTFYNVTFSGNRAEEDAGSSAQNQANGGALSVIGASSSLINVTIKDNYASGTGGGIYVESGPSDSVTLSNVILWGNTVFPPGAAQIDSTRGPGTHVSHSVVQGAFPGGVWDTKLGVDGGGNTQANPVLGTLAYHGGSTETIVPGAGSSAIDAGDDQCLAATPLSVDQRGMPRPQGSGCDIGAVEVGYATSLTVSSVSGAGSVSAAPNSLQLGGSIDACDGSDPTHCHADYAQRSVVQLNATPAANWSFAGWSGDCSGTSVNINLDMDSAKSCAASFVANADAALSVAIDDARDYVRAGQLLTYGIAVTNSGDTAVSDVEINDSLPPQLDASSAQWQCLPSGGAACTATGDGDITDTVDLPAHSSAFYILTAPVLAGHGDTVANQVGVSSDSGTISATDTTTLVIFRNGFDGDSDGHGRASATLEFDAPSENRPVDLPVARAMPGNGLSTLWRSHDGRITIECMTHGMQRWLRLIRHGSGHSARASAWINWQGNKPILARISDEQRHHWLVLELGAGRVRLQD